MVEKERKEEEKKKKEEGRKEEEEENRDLEFMFESLELWFGTHV